MTITLSAISHCVGGQIENEATVEGLSLDSRRVGPEIGFVAVPGESTDGRRFIKQALAAGAPLVIYEAYQHEAHLSPKMLGEFRQSYPKATFLAVTGLAERTGALAEAVYPVPPGSIKLAAVTGTNGKTTTTGWIAGACDQRHAPAGWSGTLGIGRYGALRSSDNTTPDIFTLWHWLHNVHINRGRYAAMEASSHALAQSRFHGLPIHTAVWTHLSQDHLDYHGTMVAYAAQKRKLLRWPSLKYCVLNLNDATAREAYVLGDYTGTPLTYQVCMPRQIGVRRSEIESADAQTESSVTPEKKIIADYVVTMLHCDSDGLHMTLCTPEGDRPWSLPCWGHYNAENAMAALLTLISFGWTLSDACDVLAQVPLPAGRLEPVMEPGYPAVLVDYAHTPDALEQVLRAARRHCTGELWVVFGCGGDRDNSKRPLMGAAAEAFADKIVLTDDNPRSESSTQIITQIQSGIKVAVMGENLWVESDRARAIAFAIGHAAKQDVVIVAGKGHEDYQEVQGERFSFNDRAVVQSAMADLHRHNDKGAC